jgi:UDP-N-acetylmuramyl pentapeptide synthase
MAVSIFACFLPAIRSANAAPMLLCTVASAAINPTGDIAELSLPFNVVEGALVAAHFGKGGCVLVDKSNANPAIVLAALKGKSYWHISRHGIFTGTNASPNHWRATSDCRRARSIDNRRRPS